jgi:hypothetical protein
MIGPLLGPSLPLTWFWLMRVRETEANALLHIIIN